MTVRVHHVPYTCANGATECFSFLRNRCVIYLQHIANIMDESMCYCLCLSTVKVAALSHLYNTTLREESSQTNVILQ